MLLLKDIVDATAAEIIFKGPESFRSLSIDSRTVQDGELFVCLRGRRFDGHDFLQDALNTASGAIIDNPEKIERLSLKKQVTILLVHNTLRSMWAMATALRRRSIRNVIGITGSNGKTTTKEMLWNILSLHGSAVKNEGNLNNDIGLPLSIINKVVGANNDFIDYGVFEMGASKQGDIKLLSEIAEPDYGVITNIGHAHLEGMGGIEGVYSTKTEMAHFVKVLFINGDDQYLRRIRSEKREVITFGLGEDSSVRAEEIILEEAGSIYMLKADIKNRYSSRIKVVTEIRLSIPGMGNIYNSLAAGAVALYLGIPAEMVKKGLEEFRGVKLRLEIKEIDGIRFIVDAYNANPDSMKNAIKELVRLKKTRAIAVLGDMLELGNYSEELHRELGREIKREGIDIFIGVGTQMKYAFEEAKERGLYCAGSPDEAAELLSRILLPGDTVLIKGSRLMAMETIFEKLQLKITGVKG
ncbi:MAG: UDP-N-acetylmuramoyl-tripeptide--D-alanyl-D-alanine ligase [Thermodesulfovibrionales bacterium]|nr:UDP-N-acetylmuramoyl-tripeptide--D-alanyl-D-alanine ligase [Thermodesulfovibrionales bacterium]